MEQRSLRLGDIVDDYCPRERRLTNHAIVAIVEDAIRQTRCTTCDYEHVYKQGREPRRRKPTASLFEQVMTDMDGPQRVPARIVVAAEAPPVPAEANVVAVEATPIADTVPAAQPPMAEEVWPGHRTLIRASLPKTDGEPLPVRPIPEFTMHQKPQSARARQPRFMYGPQGDPFGRPMRAGQPAPGRGHGNGNGNGNANGNTTGGHGQQPGKRRGRRRRGKHSH